MKLLGIQETGVTNLFLAGSSTGGPGIFYAAAKVAERYQFKKVPSPQELVSEKNVFEHGVFKNRPINSFEIYTDGVIVRSRTPSEDIEAFLDDLVSWMGELGLQRVDTHHVNKAYSSELLIEFNPGVFEIFDRLKPILALIGSEIAKATDQRVPPYQAAGFVLHTNQTQIAGMKPLPFRLERRFNTEFEKNLFYSAAPLPTKAHIKVLEQIEALAS
jgi:hypothetical protein